MEQIFCFRELQKHAKNINGNIDTVKIAILGNHTTAFFTKALKNQLIISEFKPEIYESPYDQIDMTILDQESELYRLNPEIIIILESSLKLKDQFYSTNNNHDRSHFHEDVINSYKNRIATLQANNLNSKIICFSYELIDDHLYGNIFPKVPHSFYKQLWKINNNLFDLAEEVSDFHVFEVNKYLLEIKDYRDWSLYINSDLHYSLDTFALFSHYLSLFIKSIKGSFKKCLILDLDNTLWGGIIGDDGLENIQIGSLGIGKAFTKLQKWAKELKERGIIIAICSKNNEAIAKEPFEKHNEMVLRLSDISIFVANWKNKADNIRYIQEVLNIGFDSMVFIDDNPAEREIVRQSLPDVVVPEIPEDPALYVPYLTSKNLFETASYTKNDKDRTLQYQQEAERKKLTASVTNMDDYLKSLEMEGEIDSFKNEDVSRIAQLSQMSNQFNLRTKRYSEQEILFFMNSNKHETYSIKLKDKFGDYGLVSFIILEKSNGDSYFIDTWIMSCRVLKRGLEYYAMNKVVNDINDLKAFKIIGEYIETAKNKLVCDLLKELQFIEDEKIENNYFLKLKNYKPFKTFIK